MSKPERKVTASISNDCWKALKVLAVQKEVSLQHVVQEVLEKYTSKRKVTVSDEGI